MDDIVGAAEAAELLEVELQRISRWRKKDLVDTATKPVFQRRLPPPYVLLRATPVWIKQDILLWKEGIRSYTVPAPPPIPLLGASEASAEIGVDKTQIARWRSHPTKRGPGFPTAAFQLAAGPVWTREQIEQYITDRNGTKDN